MKKYKHKATSIEEVSNRNFITESETMSVIDVYSSKNQLVNFFNNGNIPSTKEGIAKINISPKSLVNLIRKSDSKYRLATGFKTDGTHNTDADYVYERNSDGLSVKFNTLDKGYSYVYVLIGNGVGTIMKHNTVYTFFVDVYFEKEYNYGLSVTIQEGSSKNALTNTVSMGIPKIGWNRMRCTLKTKPYSEFPTRKDKGVYIGLSQRTCLSENHLIMKNAMLIEGDIPFYNYPGYFDGYTSTLDTGAVLTSCGDNIIDITKVEPLNAIIMDMDPTTGYLKFKKDDINKDTFIQFKDVLVERNTDYTLSYDVRCYNEDFSLDTYVYSENDSFSTNIPICTSPNPVFNTGEWNKIHFGIYVAPDSKPGSYEIFNLRLNRGSKKEFQPYKGNTLTLDTLSLKELPSGVKDTIDGNKITRRVGKIILNGSEGWYNMGDVANMPEDSETLGFVVNTSGKPWNMKHVNKYHTDLFTNYGTNAMYNTGDFEQIGTWSHGGSINIRIYKTRGISTVESFTNWLSENPVTLYYELDQPTVEYLDKFRIATYDGATHVKTDSNFFIPLQVTTDHSVVESINIMKDEVIIQNNKLNSLKQIQLSILNNLI